MGLQSKVFAVEVVAILVAKLGVDVLDPLGELVVEPIVGNLEEVAMAESKVVLVEEPMAIAEVVAEEVTKEPIEVAVVEVAVVAVVEQPQVALVGELEPDLLDLPANRFHFVLEPILAHFQNFIAPIDCLAKALVVRLDSIHHLFHHLDVG